MVACIPRFRWSIHGRAAEERHSVCGYDFFRWSTVSTVVLRVAGAMRPPRYERELRDYCKGAPVQIENEGSAGREAESGAGGQNRSWQATVRFAAELAA